jgi:MATE family multidrug resistance protein
VSRTASAPSTQRQIVELAWPVLIGQLAVILNGVIDTVMAGRLGTTDLAAVGLGASIYITVYVTFMGMLLALQPIIAQHFGAGRDAAIGQSFRAGLWLVPALCVPGCLALWLHEGWWALAKPDPEVIDITSVYLQAVAFGLPAALVFRAFYAFNTAVSRPKVVMTLNLVALALKIPLNAWLMYGALGVPAFGGAGCGIATAVLAWLQVALLMVWVRLDPWYQRFELQPWKRPRAADMWEVLRLGVPMALGYAIEVASFTFMTLFVARQGEVVAASHQIASNMVGVCYMLALSLSNATCVLAAQALGANQLPRTLDILKRGALLTTGIAAITALAVLLGRSSLASLYSSEARVVEMAAGLLALVAAYHFFDALQTFLVYQLRAFKVSVLPMLIYLVALWGVGLGGGWWLSYEVGGEPFSGAKGFWIAGVLSLILATVCLALVFKATYAEVYRRRVA